MKQNVSKLVWTAQIILFIGFLFFGTAKFLTPPEVAAETFGNIGGTASQYFTGAYEIASAFLVIFPATAFIGAIMIIISMAVAFILHLTIIGYEGANAILMILNIVFILISLYVIKHRRKDLLKRK